MKEFSTPDDGQANVLSNVEFIAQPADWSDTEIREAAQHILGTTAEGLDDPTLDVRIHVGASLDDLRVYMEEANDRFRLGLGPDEITEQVDHEGEHAEFNGQVGVTNMGYILRICRDPSTDTNEGRGVGVQMAHTPDYASPPSKLLRAAAHLYPKEPSDDDFADAKRLGFETPEDLLRGIQRHNRWHKDKIPLPLWYQQD